MVFVAAATAFAQVGQQQTPPQPAMPDSVSDQEMQKVVKVTDSMQTIQEEARSEVEDAVKEEGMEFARFQKIMMSKQNPQASGQVETTEKEEQAIEKIQPKVMKISQEAQQQFVQVIQEEGLTPQRFQQIMSAVQSDPEMRKRFEEAQSSDG